MKSTIKYIVRSKYYKSIKYHYNTLVTTDIRLSSKIVKKIFKTFNIKDRDLINNPIKLVDAYVKQAEFILPSVFYLDKIYKNIKEDYIERMQFIFDNCIYAVIDNKYYNTTIYRNLIKDLIDMFPEVNFSNFKKHIYKYNLDHEIKDMEKDMKFDIVVGNPPYQDPDNKNKAHPIWVKILEICFNILLKENGLIGFITPDSWMTPSSKITKYFTNKELIWLYMDGSKYFNVGSKITTYIIKNKNNDKNSTCIEWDDKKIDMNLFGMDFIPSDISEVSFKVLKSFSNEDKIIINSIGKPWRSDDKENVSKEETSDFKYKLFHTNTESIYSKKIHPNQNDKKIIINKTGTWKPFYSDNMGFTHINYAKIVSSEQEGFLVEKYLNSKLINYYIKIMNIFGARDKYTIENIPTMPAKYNGKDQDLYDYFNLTQEEIDYIEANVK
jgi:hypothetical protein